MPSLMTVKQLKASDHNNPTLETLLNEVYKPATIYQRLDNLINLYEACQHSAVDNEVVNTLKKQAAEFIAVICSTDNINGAIEERKNMRSLWPTFLPNTSLRHLRPLKFEDDKTTRMDLVKQRTVDQMRAVLRKKVVDVNPTDKILDKELGVVMLSDLEKEEFRLLPAQDKLWQLKQPKDEDNPLTIEPFDTTNHVAHTKYHGRAIFVLTPQGELFAGSSTVGKFHHSSFQRGGFVVYGGTIEVKGGKLLYIDDYSGHYAPKIKQFFNLLKEFKNRGLISTETEIHNKFNEATGMKVGSSLLNTYGFLGLPIPKNETAPQSDVTQSIDHYEILRDYFLNHVQEESAPEWQMFAAVMREYLKDHAGTESKMGEHYSEVTQLAEEKILEKILLRKPTPF